jgi:hypothetical protein
MEGLLSAITAHIATAGYCEQDEPVAYPTATDQNPGQA